MNLQRLTNNIIDTLWGNSEDDYIDRSENIDGRMKIRKFSDFLKRLGIHPDEINFYPGNKSIGCREAAVFMCLSKAPPKAKWMKKSDMVSLDKMLPIIIQLKLRRPQVVVDMDFAGIRPKRCDRTVQRSTKRKEKLQSDRRQEGWKESEFYLPICIAMAWL